MVTTNVEHAVQQFDVNDILDKLDTFKQYFSDSKLLEKITNVAKTAGATVIYPVLLLYNGNMQVGNFEKKIADMYGIGVQVANADDSALADNSVTIAAAGR